MNTVDLVVDFAPQCENVNAEVCEGSPKGLKGQFRENAPKI
jgi:hypothetical protein